MWVAMCSLCQAIGEEYRCGVAMCSLFLLVGERSMGVGGNV